MCAHQYVCYIHITTNYEVNSNKRVCVCERERKYVFSEDANLRRASQMVDFRLNCLIINSFLPYINVLVLVMGALIYLIRHLIYINIHKYA